MVVVRNLLTTCIALSAQAAMSHEARDDDPLSKAIDKGTGGTGGQPADGGHLSTGATGAEPAEPLPIPAHWGDHINYEWKPLAGKYWCKLCWKYAEEAHIKSDKHVWKTLYQEWYPRYLANKCVPPYAGAQQPPPPPHPPPPPGPPPGYTSSDASFTRKAPSRDIRSKRWHRYAVDDSYTEYWWCSPWSETDHDTSFREDAPGGWCRYKDPSTGETYWWLSDKHWFWEKSGTTMLTRFSKEVSTVEPEL